MRYLTEIIKFFSFITTGIVILFIVIMLIQGDDGIHLSTLAEIPCAGLVTAAVTVLLYPNEVQSRKKYLLRVLLHYSVLCVIMITMGTLFGWIAPDAGGILLMLISVAVIYLFTFAVAYITSKNDADEMNRVLKDRNKK